MATRKFLQRTLGLDARRKFPTFASIRKIQHAIEGGGQTDNPQVLFLTDSFSHYFHPETEAAGRRALEALALRVKVIPAMGTGRTLISKGFLEAAKRHADHLLEVIDRLDPKGCLPIVGVEPSEIATFRDEFLDFFPNDKKVKELAKRAWMVDEFLLRPDADGSPRISRFIPEPANGHLKPKVLLHGHCYQKAQPPAADGFPTGVAATVAMLESLGYKVEIADSGCCGMAGAFGYEKEHYDISMKVGELTLFPAVRKNGGEMIVAASGTSCRSQIVDGTGRSPVHPVCLIQR
jgi:Fe-S oxidoreductase